MKFFLTINDSGEVELETRRGTEVERGTIKTIEDLEPFLDIAADLDIPVMCSSSLDFPCEYTDDPDVIELARQIRS